jgi:hypothetical protein
MCQAPTGELSACLTEKRIGSRCKTQARLPCRRGGSSPRCSPECSTITCIFVCCLFDHCVHHTELAICRRGIRRGKGTDYQTFDENSHETTQFRGKSASNGTGPAPSFWIRPLLDPLPLRSQINQCRSLNWLGRLAIPRPSCGGM